MSREALGCSQPPIQWVPGDISQGIKRKGREADHSPPTSAEVKNDGTIPSLPIRLHDVVLNYSPERILFFQSYFYFLAFINLISL
jgi:hypothetical protein